MRHYKKILMLGLLVGAMFTSSRAQTITFYFVAPIATINANFPPGGDTTRMPLGYSMVQITAANTATFLTVAPARIRGVFNQLQTGTALRRQVERVFNNSGRLVDLFYFLVDDQAGFTNPKPHMLSVAPRTLPNNVWPAANNAGPLGTGRYIGWVMLGEQQLNTDQVTRDGGLAALDEVVLHETSHTQWVGVWSKWPATSSGIITYGADGSHSVTELLGDQESAINEGIGTFYGYTINTVAMDSMFARYSSTLPRYFVEGRSVMAGDRELVNTPRRRDTLRVRRPDGTIVTPLDTNNIPFIYWRYQWRDIPGYYLLWAENTSTAFYSLYWRNAYSNRDTAFSFIGFSANSMFNGRMKRFLTYSCNRLALKMEEYNATATGRADTSKTSSMLPYAVLDLVTHFGMTDSVYRADHDRVHPDRNPRAFNEYFTNHRAAVRALVNADLTGTPIRFLDAMTRIRTYFRQPATIF